MTTLNPETEDTEKAENKEDILLDKAYKLAKGEMKLEDLPEEEQLEFHQRFVVDEEEIPEPSDLKPDEGGEDLEKGNIQESESKLDENQEFLKERKRKLDELNTINQKAENARKRLEELEAIQTTVHEKPKGDEIFSEESTEKLHERIRILESNQKSAIESEKTTLKDETRDLVQKKIFTEISSFQFENPELKTSKPMDILNAGYAKFISDMGGHENVDKFLHNKEFRAQKESEGFVFPMTDIDFGKFTKISMAIKYKGERNYPDLDAAYYKYQKENGQVSDSVKQASLDATSKVLEQLAGNADNTQTLSPGDGQSSDEKGGMSEAAMEKWLHNNPYPSTPKEIAMQKQIHNQLFGSPGG